MNIVDVIDLDEATEKLEWHARKLAQFDGRDPDMITNTGKPLWMVYLPEAKRFMIGVEAWFGHSGLIMPHGNGKIEDAELIDLSAD